MAQYLRIIELSREREDDGWRAYEATVFSGWDAERDGGMRPLARAMMMRNG